MVRGELLAARAPGLTLTPRTDLAMIAVQGPQCAGEGLAGAARQRAGDGGAEAVHRGHVDDPVGRVFIARTGYTGEDGFEIVICRRRRRPSSGRRSPRRACARRASARATRCGSRPA